MTRLIPLGVAIVMAIVIALNLTGGRIVGSQMEIDRQTRPRFYWAMIGLQAAVFSVCLWWAVFGLPHSPLSELEQSGNGS